MKIDAITFTSIMLGDISPLARCDITLDQFTHTVCLHWAGPQSIQLLPEDRERLTQFYGLTEQELEDIQNEIQVRYKQQACQLLYGTLRPDRQLALSTNLRILRLGRGLHRVDVAHDIRANWGEFCACERGDFNFFEDWLRYTDPTDTMLFRMIKKYQVPPWELPLLWSPMYFVSRIPMGFHFNLRLSPAARKKYSKKSPCKSKPQKRLDDRKGDTSDMDSDTHKTDAAKPRVERTTVTPEDAKRLGKSPGEYCTIFTGDLCALPSVCAAGTCLAETIEPFLTPYFGKKLCLCGLGNPNIMGNALGADTIKGIPAHLLDYSTTQQDKRFTQVFTFTPDIPYATNLSTETFLSTFLSAAQADFAILVHPTLTQDVSAFCRTIQISTASQTRSHAGETTDWSAIGAPVLHVGVPLVFDLAGLLLEDSRLDVDELAQQYQTSLSRLTTYQITDVTAVRRQCSPLV